MRQNRQGTHIAVVLTVFPGRYAVCVEGVCVCGGCVCVEGVRVCGFKHSLQHTRNTYTTNTRQIQILYRK